MVSALLTKSEKVKFRLCSHNDMMGKRIYFRNCTACDDKRSQAQATSNNALKKKRAFRQISSLLGRIRGLHYRSVSFVRCTYLKQVSWFFLLLTDARSTRRIVMWKWTSHILPRNIRKLGMSIYMYIWRNSSLRVNWTQIVQRPYRWQYDYRIIRMNRYVAAHYTL